MYGEHKIIMKYYSVFGIFIVIIKMQSARVYLVEKLPWLIYVSFLLRDVHNFNAYLYFLFIMTILKNLSLRFLHSSIRLSSITDFRLSIEMFECY